MAQATAREQNMFSTTNSCSDNWIQPNSFCWNMYTCHALIPPNLLRMPLITMRPTSSTRRSNKMFKMKAPRLLWVVPRKWK